MKTDAKVVEGLVLFAVIGAVACGLGWLLAAAVPVSEAPAMPPLAALAVLLLHATLAAVNAGCWLIAGFGGVLAAHQYATAGRVG